MWFQFSVFGFWCQDLEIEVQAFGFTVGDGDVLVHERVAVRALLRRIHLETRECDYVCVCVFVCVSE